MLPALTMSVQDLYGQHGILKIAASAASVNDL